MAIADIYSKVPNTEINSLKDKIDIELWEIYKVFYSIVFFFYTNQQLDKYKDDGVTENRLKDICFNLLKEYDEFDYLNMTNFDIQLESKENFENKYKGNWFYFSKR